MFLEEEAKLLYEQYIINHWHIYLLLVFTETFANVIIRIAYI